jgi:hypothetical protein
MIVRHDAGSIVVRLTVHRRGKHDVEIELPARGDVVARHGAATAAP